MKGVIIIPTFYEKRHRKGRSSRGKFLFNRISQTYKFPIIYTDTPDLKNFDVAVIYAVPYHNRPEIPPGLLESKTKLIGYFEDLQCWDNKECQKNKEIMFDRYDIIMGAYYEKFKKWYPQHIHKYVYFPNFFFPYKKYVKLQVPLKPKMKCLMIGSVNEYYPFRVFIRKHRDKKGLLDVSRKKPFSEYPEFLSKYFCAIATVGILRGTILSKYFEIPAARVLMLAEEIMELKMVGLEANVHYVPITKKNVFSQIKKVLKKPKDYISIRDKATEFVRKNHSEINRTIQFKEVLKRIEGLGI